MKATNTGTSSQPPRAHQGDSNLKGAAKMKLTMQIEKAKQGLTNRIRNHTPAKLLGALVLGATLVTVSATILVAGQPEASDQPSQMALGEEWFHPVTGEPIGLLLNQQNQVLVTQRSQGVRASPLIIGLGNWSPGEEYFHPVTGKNNVAARQTMSTIEVSGFGLGEEYFHPVTGANNAGAREMTAPMQVSGFGLGEEYFHPVTSSAL